jgi:hypothetical protein
MSAVWGILARIVANLIQKFKTQSSAVTLRRREQWRYADKSDDVTWARR